MLSLSEVLGSTAFCLVDMPDLLERRSTDFAQACTFRLARASPRSACILAAADPGGRSCGARCGGQPTNQLTADGEDGAVAAREALMTNFLDSPRYMKSVHSLLLTIASISRR